MTFYILATLKTKIITHLMIFVKVVLTSVAVKRMWRAMKPTVKITIFTMMEIWKGVAMASGWSLEVESLRWKMETVVSVNLMMRLLAHQTPPTERALHYPQLAVRYRLTVGFYCHNSYDDRTT